MNPDVTFVRALLQDKILRFDLRSPMLTHTTDDDTPTYQRNDPPVFGSLTGDHFISLNNPYLSVTPETPGSELYYPYERNPYMSSLSSFPNQFLYNDIDPQFFQVKSLDENLMAPIDDLELNIVKKPGKKRKEKVSNSSNDILGIKKKRDQVKSACCNFGSPSKLPQSVQKM